MCHNSFWRFCGWIFAAAFVTACASDQGTKSGTCSAYDSTRQSTEYSARLIAADKGDQYELQIQAIHPITMASPIKRISLNDGTTLDINMLEDNCVCGMQIRNVDVECTHITTYIATIPEKTLVAVMDKGLAMTFLLENGHIVAGPKIDADDIRNIMRHP